MTILIPHEMIRDIFVGIGDDEELVQEDLPPTDEDLRNIRIGMRDWHAEPFVRLFLEWVLKSDDHREWGVVSSLYDIDARPTITALHAMLFGPLPPGPRPNLRIVSAFRSPDIRKRYAKPGETFNDWRDITRRMMPDLYGPPPYDYDALRARAMG